MSEGKSIKARTTIDGLRRDVDQARAERDKYREALERAARLAELEPDSLVGQVVREALDGR